MMATSPTDLAATLGDEQQRFYTMELLKRAVPYLPMFEDAAFAGSAAPSGFNAAELAAQYAQGPQDYTQAQGAARPTSFMTASQQAIMQSAAEQSGVDPEAQYLQYLQYQQSLAQRMGQKLDETMRAALAGPTVPYDEAQRQAAEYQQAQTLTPEVLRKAMQYLRDAPGQEERAQAALQMIQSGMVTWEEYRAEAWGEAEDDDPVWTDV